MAWVILAHSHTKKRWVCITTFTYISSPCFFSLKVMPKDRDSGLQGPFHLSKAILFIPIFQQEENYCVLFFSDTDYDTRRSFFTESGRCRTRYLRILRVCFVQSYNEPLNPSHYGLLRLNYVTFEPRMISTGGIFGIPIYESMAITMKRAMMWLNRNSKYSLLSYSQ